MRRKTNTKYIQLEFDFTYDTHEELVDKAEQIIEKYLCIYDRIFDVYRLFSKEGERRLYEVYRRNMTRLIKVANNEINKLDLYCYDFLDLEDSLSKNEEARRNLDAFGYIQQLHDLNSGRIEEKQIYGYWYWLFEDAIAQIPIPVEIIKKYRIKYEEFRKSKQSV